MDRPAKAQTVAKEYGGEKKDSSEDDVSTKCTEACGSDLSGKHAPKSALSQRFHVAKMRRQSGFMPSSMTKAIDLW